MNNELISLIVGVLFVLADVILYIYLAEKYKTYNPFKISKIWIKHYM